MSKLITYVPQVPSLRDRIKQMVRSYTVGPYSLKDPALAKLFGSGAASFSGINVTESNAYTFSAVYDAVNQISSDVSKLPLNLHKRIQGGGSELYTESKVFRLLKHEPNPHMGSMVFRRTLQAHALTCHGGFAEIERDGADRPFALWPLTPDRVEPMVETIRRDNGRFASVLWYRVDGDRRVEARDMIHLHGLGYDGYSGYSTISMARQAIGLALAAERFGSTFFGNGTAFGGILSSDTPLGPDEEDVMRKHIEALHASAEKAHRFLVLSGGWKYERLGVEPEKAQMNDLRNKQVEEVARFFNIPLHKLKNLDRSTNNNIEHQDLEYYKGCLLTWITLWEEELNRKLISPLESRQQFIKHNANAFLRGDIKSRYDALGIARDKGIINADEWRELEDMNPQPNGQGKTYLVQSAQIPVDMLPAFIDAQIEKMKQKPAPPQPGGGGDREALLERLEKAEQAVTEALAEAQREREQRIALEATGTAKEDELAQRRWLEAAAVGRAAELDILAAQLRVQVDAQERIAEEFAQRIVDVQHAHAETVAQAEARIAEAQAERDRRADEARQFQALAAQRQAEREDLEAASVATITALTAANEAEAVARAECERLLTATQGERDQFAIEAEDAKALAAQRQTEREELEASLAATAADLATAKAAEAEARSAWEDAVRMADEARIAAEAAVAEQNRLAEEAAAAVNRATEADRLAAEAAQRAADEAQARADAEQKAQEAHAAADAAEAIQGLLSDVASDASKRAGEAAGQRDRLRDTLEAARRAEQMRLSAVLAAHRGLIVDDVGRMVRRECEQARSRQATQEKLRKWLGTYPALHEAVFVEALLPTIRTLLAWRLSDEDPVTRTTTLAQEHIAAFTAQIRTALDADPTDFHAVLEKVLTRWEADRANTVADAFLAEEIRHART